MENRLLFSCEHASNVIPAEYSSLFADYPEQLKSHLGYDIGAELFFDAIKTQIKADFLIKASYSRLLIELNRSLHHKELFSSISKPLSKLEKEHIIQTYYTPYRKELEKQVFDFIHKGDRVIHLSIHSFTSILNNNIRLTDIGILYDPKNMLENFFCMAWKLNLKKQLPQLVIRSNKPYLGKADGLTTYLRKQFPTNYLGIELEIKNSLIESKDWSNIQQELISSFEKTVEGF